MTELSTSQVAERMNVTRHTVGIWCRRGLFPNAREVDTPRGAVWLIPEGDLRGFVRPKATGRPPKPKADDGPSKANGAAGRKRAAKKGWSK